jgi:hypothetical protein
MTLSELEQAAAAAGVLISRRQLMRHCASGTFDAKKLPAVNNIEEWFIAPASVEKGFADIKTLQEQRARRDATRPDMSGHDGLDKPEDNRVDMSGHVATRRDMTDLVAPEISKKTEPDTSGHDGLRPAMSDLRRDEKGQTHSDTRYIEQLEKRLIEKDEVIGMLRGELVHRNEELVRRNERERETNILIRGLQNLVLRLQPGKDPTADVLDGDVVMRDKGPSGPQTVS